jgi:predicted  nucleic acid-binding Zn-ribbon protein
VELYDFIRNDFPKPSPREEGLETVAALQNERESFTDEREMLQERIAVLESRFAELKKERDDLVLQLQAAEIDRSAAFEAERSLRESVTALQEKAEALAADREELLGRLAEFENHAAALKRERNDLEMQMQSRCSEKDNALREADDLLKVKSSEIEQLRTDISALRQELSETLARMGRVETEKHACLNELERVRKEFSVYRQKAKKTIVVACIVAALAAATAGFLSHYAKSTASEQKRAGLSVSTYKRTGEKAAERSLLVAGFSASLPQGRTKDPISAKWPGRPFALDIGSFKVSVIPLKSGTLKRLPAALRHEETDTHHFYLVKIRAARGALSAEFMKSPFIDFINRDNAHARQTGSGLRIVPVLSSGKRHANKETVLFRCLVSLRKDFRPIGILIGHPNDEISGISIY